ncbi:helix-turn-helix domain-containing protein [Geobacter anodireducens]
MQTTKPTRVNNRVSTVPAKSAVQQELFKAETTWFHIFKTMIDSGDAAKMGGTTFLVYAVIKAHANYSTGCAFPAIETIAKKAGISPDQVTRCVKKLEELNYIAKEKKGRQNVYTLREKVQMLDGEGRPAAVATWDYLPSTISEATAEIRNYLVTGQHTGTIINIERLYLQINNGGQNVQVNIGDISDPELRKQLQSFYEKFQARMAD